MARPALKERRAGRQPAISAKKPSITGHGGDEVRIRIRRFRRLRRNIKCGSLPSAPLRTGAGAPFDFASFGFAQDKQGRRDDKRGLISTFAIMLTPLKASHRLPSGADTFPRNFSDFNVPPDSILSASRGPSSGKSPVGFLP